MVSRDLRYSVRLEVVVWLHMNAALHKTSHTSHTDLISFHCGYVTLVALP